MAGGRRQRLRNPLSLRIDDKLYADLRFESIVRDEPLADIVRRRLEGVAYVQAELSSVRQELECLRAELRPGRPTATLPGIDARSVATEVVLLLRSIAGPQRCNMAHSEVQRVGLQVWSSKAPGDP
jgi:hypothetical protein